MAKGKSKKSKETRSTEPDPSLYYGKGSFTFPNGDTYEGDYCAHRIGLMWREGHGVYQTHDGQTYEGDWKDDKLTENKELIVKYPNGAGYYGCLSKNKYKGPGTYSLECKMDLSCNFEGNQPVGTVVLVDYEGKLWVGEAKGDKAILLPENIFYLNLSEENGKGFPLEEQTPSLKSIEEEKGAEGAKLTDREWEKLIFKKSSQTENDVDFNESTWVKKFERFRKRKEEVLRKFDEGESLTDEEQLWMEKFERHRAKRKQKREENVLLKRKASEEAMALIEKFRSPEFNDGCPGVSVIYASPYFIEENLKEEPENKIPCEESEDDLFEDACIRDEEQEKGDGSNATIASYYGLESIGNFRSARFDNLIKLKDYVKQLELPRSKLHFTVEREKRRAEIGEKLAQMKEEAATAAKLSTKASEPSKFKNTEKEMKHLEKKNKKPSEVSSVKRKGSTTSKITIDEKTALQERIKKYVEEHFESKEKLKLEEMSEIILPKRLIHTHNVAVCTGVPRKSRSNSFDSVKN